MNTVCIIMAAGAGRRFGANKLTALFHGEPLYARALDAIPARRFSGVIVVSGTKEILAAAREKGFLAVLNDRPEDGVSRTIRLALEEAARFAPDAAMFMVADQPLLTETSVCALMDEFEADGAHIVAMGDGERRGNPAIFPGKYFAALSALTGDRGGSDVIRENASALILHQIADGRELFDVDSAAELERLTRL